MMLVAFCLITCANFAPFIVKYLLTTQAVPSWLALPDDSGPNIYLL